MLERKLDQVKLENYISTLKDMKLDHLDASLSERETMLTSNMAIGINDRIIEDSDSSCSSDSVSPPFHRFNDSKLTITAKSPVNNGKIWEMNFS